MSHAGCARRQKDKCLFLLYVDANSLVNSKGPTNVASAGAVATASGGGVAMEFTVKELYAIEEIHSETNLLRLITGLDGPAALFVTFTSIAAHSETHCIALLLLLLLPLLLTLTFQ